MIVEMGDYMWSEDELRTAILQELQQFLQERLRHLVRSMTRCVTELHNKRGGYTRYCLATSQAMELSEQLLAVKNVVQFGLYVA
jgi:arginine decarboxylase-like protein